MIICRYCGQKVPGDLSCQHCGASDVWAGGHPVSPPITVVQAYGRGLADLVWFRYSDGVVICVDLAAIRELIDHPRLSVTEIGNIIRFHWEELCQTTLSTHSG